MLYWDWEGGAEVLAHWEEGGPPIPPATVEPVLGGCCGCGIPPDAGVGPEELMLDDEGGVMLDADEMVWLGGGARCDWSRLLPPGGYHIEE